MKIVLAVILLSFYIAGIYSLGKRLARNHGSDVRIVFYLFSFFVFLIIELGTAATLTDSIDETGKATNKFGGYFLDFVYFLIDIKLDIAIPTLVAATVVGPQILSYVFSGLLGCGAPPILTSRTWSFFIWSLVKSFSIVSGASCSIAIFFPIFNIEDLWNKMILAFHLSLMLIAFSLLLLYCYHEAGSSLAEFMNNRPHGWIARWHNWATRNEANPGGVLR